MIDELDIANNINSEIPFDTTKKGLPYKVLVKAMILNGLGYVNEQLYLPPWFFKDKPLRDYHHIILETLGSNYLRRYGLELNGEIGAQWRI